MTQITPGLLDGSWGHRNLSKLPESVVEGIRIRIYAKGSDSSLRSVEVGGSCKFSNGDTLLGGFEPVNNLLEALEIENGTQYAMRTYTRTYLCEPNLTKPDVEGSGLPGK